MNMIENPNRIVVAEAEPETVSIPKPNRFDLENFKSTSSATAGSIETLLTALPVLKISEARDFVRLHPDEREYWTAELCFVNVPIKGQMRDTLHLINEHIAMRHLPSAQIFRFRLALAAKPFDKFFLCRVPSQNLDNPWNMTNLQACEQAKTFWARATSQEGVEGYTRDPDVFPAPNWPTQPLEDLIGAAFAPRMITKEDHPGILRLIGAKQVLS
jgi:hypothetical protein